MMLASSSSQQLQSLSPDSGIHPGTYRPWSSPLLPLLSQRAYVLVFTSFSPPKSQAFYIFLSGAKDLTSCRSWTSSTDFRMPYDLPDLSANFCHGRRPGPNYFFHALLSFDPSSPQHAAFLVGALVRSLFSSCFFFLMIFWSGHAHPAACRLRHLLEPGLSFCPPPFPLPVRDLPCFNSALCCMVLRTGLPPFRSCPRSK